MKEEEAKAVEEALAWAESCVIRPDMVPFDATRLERQFAKVLAAALLECRAELAKARTPEGACESVCTLLAHAEQERDDLKAKLSEMEALVREIKALKASLKSIYYISEKIMSISEDALGEK